jgi:hypothetical protein
MCQGTVIIDPTPASLQKFWDRISWHLFRIRNNTSRKGANWMAIEARRYVHSWTSMFALCGDMSSYRAKALNRIALTLG